MEARYCADSGADLNIIPHSLVERLVRESPKIERKQLTAGVDCITVGGRILTAKETVECRIKIHTAAGAVRPVDPVTFHVLKMDSDEVLLGNHFLSSLGIDVQAQLERLAEENPEDEKNTGAERDNDLLHEPDADELREAVEEMIRKAIARGFPKAKEERLRTIVYMFDIWRITMGRDPPARVTPLKVALKENATPFRCKPRRYTPQQKAFLEQFNKELEKLGWVFKNNQSRWASAAIPVPKAKGEFRQANDYRSVNQRTVPIAGTMPHLLSVMEYAKGKKHYGLFDFLKGFWQLPLDKASQEILSYMTHDNVYTPTRVPQGCTDAAIHFQATMTECFEELLYSCLLIWIDDLLLYADDIDSYLDNMQRLFQIMSDKGLKLSVKKTELYQSEVKWCGKILNAEGVKHDPNRIAALRAMPYPTTAAQLQQFLCACNWLRESLVDYARIVAPLQRRLDQALQGSRRTKRIAAGLTIELTTEEKACFDQVKDLLGKSMVLSHPDDSAITCLFTDASDTGWAVVITQVRDWNDDRAIHEQEHRLLVCLSGAFQGAQRNWSVIEKEAYPIVHACTQLDYLLLRPGGFRMYCDHRNLIHVFAPGQEIKKHVRGKLLRWATRLVEFDYVIEHIEGPHNVWADLLSRWGQPPVDIAVRRVRTRSSSRPTRPRPPRTAHLLRPLDDDGFIWPSFSEIRGVQQQYSTSCPRSAQRKREGVWYINHKLWIPSEASSLTQRLLIIAHCGPQGHRGVQAMHTQLAKLFEWRNMRKDIELFMQNCLVCQRIKGPKIIKRPWSETFRTANRNEALHWDFLYLGESFGDSKYLLVMKDEATHFCELIVCDTPSSEVAVEALLDWRSRFGSPKILISDSASHFKNEVLRELTRRLKSRQQFTVAYSPWINGTVERLNRDILQVLRAMLTEYKLDLREWTCLVPLVQSNLNHTAVPSLSNYSPVELFTGLEAESPLSTIYVPGTHPTVRDIAISGEIQQKMQHLRSSLKEMHKKVLTEKEKRERLNQNKSNYHRVVNFSVGDYVLRSRVDQKNGPKLLATWVGPYQVVAEGQYHFTVRDLLTSAEMDVHPSRLKFYADNKFQVTEELIDEISRQGLVLHVKKLSSHRWHAEKMDFEILVEWRGLEAIENSWELLSSLGQDIPVLVQQYVDASEDSRLKEHFKATVQRPGRPSRVNRR